MEWFPDWGNELVAVVASGPSTSRQEVEKLRGRCKVAVVNNNYQLAPWADVLYAADPRWWDVYSDAKQFEGMKVTCDPQVASRRGLLWVKVMEPKDGDHYRMLWEPKGTIGSGGNGAFQLVNLLIQFGCRKLILVGVDFCGSHWHDDHPKPLIPRPQEKTLKRWREALDNQAGLLAVAGVSVLVASTVSTLTAYPKVSGVDEALDAFA